MSRAVALHGLAPALSAIVLGACTNAFEPVQHDVELPRIAGQVLVARTGEPVTGAEIFTHYQVSYGGPGAFHASTLTHASRWATTDAEGRFAFEPLRFEAAGTKDPRGLSPLFLVLIDRRYGRVYLDEPRDSATWSDLEFRVEPDPDSLELMEAAHNVPSLCPTGDVAADYVHCCELVFGGEEEECQILRRRFRDELEESERDPS